MTEDTAAERPYPGGATMVVALEIGHILRLWGVNNVTQNVLITYAADLLDQLVSAGYDIDLTAREAAGSSLKGDDRSGRPLPPTGPQRGATAGSGPLDDAPAG